MLELREWRLSRNVTRCKKLLTTRVLYAKYKTCLHT
jgi:hypothetical protein